MLRNFRDGEIGCVIVCIPVHGQYKAKVVHGHNEDEYNYGNTKIQAVEGLKEKILSKSSFKHYIWIVLENGDLQ